MYSKGFFLNFPVDGNTNPKQILIHINEQYYFNMSTKCIE